MKKVFVLSVVIFFGLFFDRLNIFKYCILSSFLHEAGHILRYIALTDKFPKIEFSVFGFKMKNDIKSLLQLTVILICGPLANMILVFYCFSVLSSAFSLSTYVFMIVNALIFTVNMLPVYYLDGGQLLYNYFTWYRDHYLSVSLITVVLISVMVIYFTDVNYEMIIPFVAFITYFSINSLQVN